MLIFAVQPMHFFVWETQAVVEIAAERLAFPMPQISGRKLRRGSKTADNMSAMALLGKNDPENSKKWSVLICSSIA